MAIWPHMAVFGWSWLVLAGAGWFWLVLSGPGWFWLVLAGFGWSSLVLADSLDGALGGQVETAKSKQKHPLASKPHKIEGMLLNHVFSGGSGRPV